MLGSVLLALVLRQSAEPLYPSSVVGTDFDFILETDRSVFEKATFVKKGSAEMPDKIGEGVLFHAAYQFKASYSDQVTVNFAVHHKVGSVAAATKQVEKAAVRLGRIPHILRKGVDRVVINMGDATAFSDRGLIVLYTENMDKRISTHDLEETIFHESVHATWDASHLGTAEWEAAQKSDPGFVTQYGNRQPWSEDLAESALFVVTLVHFPDRLPKDVSEKLRAQMPARIAYIEKLFPKTEKWHGPADET